MKTQINLLDDLSARTAGIAPVTWIKIFVAGLILITLGTVFQGTYVKIQHGNRHQLEVKLAASFIRLTDIQNKYPRINQEKQIASENKQLIREIKKQQDILSLLAIGNKLQTKGFYQYLSALSDNARKGIWLTEIELVPGKDQARLKGQAWEPELVPIYIKDLSNTKFSGTDFGQLSVTQISKRPKLYEFELDSSIAATTTVAER